MDDPAQVPKAARILKAIWTTCFSRLSQVLPGNPQANSKMIRRFLAVPKPQEAVWRLYDEEASFVLADPTEIPCPQAKKTEDVGT